MNRTIEQLWDIEEIKQLKARYFRCIDTKDWDTFAQLFTEDCVHHLPQESSTATVSNDQYLRDMKVQLGNGTTIHHGHMPEITLLSDTEAEGIWAMFDYVETELPSGPIKIQGYGHYFETYRRGSTARGVSVRNGTCGCGWTVSTGPDALGPQ